TPMMVQSLKQSDERSSDDSARSTAATATTVCSSAYFKKCPAVPVGAQSGSVLRIAAIAGKSARALPQPISAAFQASGSLAMLRPAMRREASMLAVSSCNQQRRSRRLAVRLGRQLALDHVEQIADGRHLLEVAAVEADAELRFDPQHDAEEIDRVELKPLADFDVVVEVIGTLPRFLFEHVEERL